MRFQRWLNPSLPQMLQFAVILLYIEGVFGLISLLGLPFGGSAYFAVWALLHPRGDWLNTGTTDALVDIVVLVASLAYLFAGLAIANEQRRGWLVGVIVSGGAVLLPLLAVGPAILLSSYVFTYAFAVALLALLVHPQTRAHQKVWFS